MTTTKARAMPKFPARAVADRDRQRQEEQRKREAVDRSDSKGKRGTRRREGCSGERVSIHFPSRDRRLIATESVHEIALEQRPSSPMFTKFRAKHHALDRLERASGETP
jgi:hypothetical protein